MYYFFFFKCWEKLSCPAKKINWHWLSQGLAIKIDFKILEFKVTLGIQSRPALVYLEEGGIQEGGGGVRSYKLPLFKDETMDNNQHMKVVGSMYFCSWHKVDHLDHPPLLKPVGEGGQR